MVFDDVFLVEELRRDQQRGAAVARPVRRALGTAQVGLSVAQLAVNDDHGAAGIGLWLFPVFAQSDGRQAAVDRQPFRTQGFHRVIRCIRRQAQEGAQQQDQ